jgi:hypothetical protein
VADLTVFDRPLTNAQTLREAHVSLTIVGGKIEFEHP